MSIESGPVPGYFPASGPGGYRTYPAEQPPTVSAVTRALEPADPFSAPSVTPVEAPLVAVPADQLYSPQCFAPQPYFATPPRPNVGLFRAVKLMFANTTNFSGRASRTEFWYAALAIVTAAVVGLFVLAWAVGGSPWFLRESAFPALLAIVALICAVALILPFASLTVRRLHDANHSGALWFLNFIPGVGSLILAAICTEAPSGLGGRFDDPSRWPQES
ncbi:MAG: DUF805 domain-containing protein [Propionibacteriaceae bacterium]|jgi:uncharacterized membrane protein YhaH (DUF805 family)|nr:DUF805 domain-containing protein [Propionibacteriaceae bacterium]